MKFILFHISKKQQSISNDWEKEYTQRIQRYIPFNSIIIPPLKVKGSLSIEELRKKESQMLIDRIPENTPFILLDERGKNFDSPGFAKFINQNLLSGYREVYFLMGGAYGFDESIRAKAKFIISLSKLTFSHQLARLVFLEQLYRAFTILYDQPYHH